MWTPFDTSKTRAKSLALQKQPKKSEIILTNSWECGCLQQEHIVQIQLWSFLPKAHVNTSSMPSPAIPLHK